MKLHQKASAVPKTQETSFKQKAHANLTRYSVLQNISNWIKAVKAAKLKRSIYFVILIVLEETTR